MADHPIRIQRSRVKGWRMPPNTVYVGRPTKWGSPFIVGTLSWFLDKGADVWVKTPRQAVELYRDWLMHHPGAAAACCSLEELRGKNLACWCPLNQPCHADVLLDILMPLKPGDK